MTLIIKTGARAAVEKSTPPVVIPDHIKEAPKLVVADSAPTPAALREPFSPGVYEGISNRDYHADQALGSTSLRTLALRTPAHYKWESEHPVHKDVFDFGTVAHSYILEGDHSGVEVIDVPDKRGNKWTIPAAEAREAGKIAVTAAEWADVEGMRESVMAHPLASTMLTGHRAEVSVFWEEGGQMFKCRPDAWKPGLIADLKTSRDANPNEFGKGAFDYGYFMSAPHYVDGVKAATGEDVKFIFINVEKTAPYLVSITELTDADLDRGRLQLDRAKRIYKDCTINNDWTGYPEFSTTQLPRWAQIELDEMEATNE